MAPPVALDIPTLFAVLCLINLAGLAFAVALSLTRQVFAGAKLWIAGQAVIVAASAVMLFRGAVPPWLGIVFTNTAYLAAQLLLLASVWQFRFSRAIHWAWWLLVPAFAALNAALVGASVNARVAAFGTVVGLVSLATAASLFRRIPRPLRPPSYFLGATFLATGLVQAARVPLALLSPAAATLNDPHGFNAGFYLVSILSAFAMLFGYFLMSSLRFNLDLRGKESAIQKTNRELQESNRIRGLLLAVIGHDLKAPIDSASRYVNNFLLPPEVKLEEKQNAVAILGITLAKASKLLADLILWADKPRDFERQPIAVRALAQAVLDEAAAEFQAKSMVGENLCEDLSAVADPQGVTVVLRNLVSNAIKFSHPGTRVRLLARPAGAQVRIEVQDQGIGIAPENLERLRRADSLITTTGTFGEYGNGLGLLLCRSLAQRNGGTLEIESVPGKGTTFLLTLPAGPR